MIDANEYLIHLPEQQVLVCRSCKYCLQPDGVYQHLQRSHLTIPVKVRKELIEYTEDLTLRGPTKVITPTRSISAFECLKIIDGFQCSVCNTLCGTIGSVKKHCATAHKWTEFKGISSL